jgi:hypothetical protein
MFASGKPMQSEVPPGGKFPTDSVGDQGGAVTFAICAQGLKAVRALPDFIHLRGTLHFRESPLGFVPSLL